MQFGYIPLQLAVENGHHRTVQHFIEAKMNMTNFDMVCNINTLFYVYSIVVGGVAWYNSVWGYYH